MEADPDPYPSVFNHLILLQGEPVFSYQALTILLLLALLFMITSALMSGSEVAFFSLSQSDLTAQDTEKHPSTKKILNLLDKPHLLLSTILVTNTFVNLGTTIVFGLIIELLIDTSSILWWIPVLINVVFVTGLIVLFGEITPKVYATANTLKIAQMMAGPMLILRTLWYPFSYLLANSTRVIEKRMANQKGNNIASIDDFDTAIDLTMQDSASAQDKNILMGIVKFSHTNVTQIMCPRVDMVTISEDSPLSALIEAVKINAYSRIPVYRQNEDQIIGIVHTKDLLEFLDKNEDHHWQKAIRPVFFVPENKKIDDLLLDFRTKRVHMAIVVDEYGGTMGLVTLEDIMEEIVGDIRDEFDDEKEDIPYHKIDDKNYIFEGKVFINDFCKILSIKKEELLGESEGSDTLAGMVIEKVGRIPKSKEEFHIGDIKLTIVKATMRKIEQVKVTLKN